MGCPYCTPITDPDTGESWEFCKEFVRLGEDNDNTLIRTFLSQDNDDGSWWVTVLMADNWPMRTMPIVMTYDAPPFCPHCGRRLYEQKPEEATHD